MGAVFSRGWYPGVADQGQPSGIAAVMEYVAQLVGQDKTAAGVLLVHRMAGVDQDCGPDIASCQGQATESTGVKYHNPTFVGLQDPILGPSGKASSATSEKEIVLFPGRCYG